ncbi:MAG: FAD-dependent oxidoreductase [Pirellulales bacterium]|nr:FAD-dependent oxidoreductase [Pirellulales bacterium]
MHRLLIAAILLCAGIARGAEQSYDLVIYGGTSGAVTAAVQAKSMGRSVVIVSPDKHVGGLSSGGLGYTDTGRKEVIGGLSREFYHRVWKHYQKPEAWNWSPPKQLPDQGGGPHSREAQQSTMWIFEPHVAEAIFDAWVKEQEIPVVRDAWLDRQLGVRMDGNRIQSITTLDGRTFTGRIFIDATYEGDLMAAAKVDYHVGREANCVYGETFNGVQTGVLHHRHHFGVLKRPVDPYRVPGDPSSGLLPRISPAPPGTKGEGDHRLQAYCFRMCLSDVPENRVPFPKPDGYDPQQYALLLRVFDAGWREVFDKFDRIPNGKTDTNNHGPFSTDNIGMNYDYPEASYERRREIIQEHEVYQKGLMYFLANDPRVPEDVRTAIGRWGLAKDEFADTGHWPRQIYVREARRMLGRFVMTENVLLKRNEVPEPVGMGSYTMDSHNVQRYVTPDGHVQNEGDIGVGTNGPYQISYGSLVPKKGQCENLLVPVCVSSSHIAYGSIRMEPVFMVLGQSAATAAVQAIEDGVAVQDVDYKKLRARLLADGQVLEWIRPAPGGREEVPSLKSPAAAVQTQAGRGGKGHGGAAGQGTVVFPVELADPASPAKPPRVHDLAQFRDGKGFPIEYVLSFETHVCTDNQCKAVEVTMAWNVAGYFERLTCPPGKPLTKKDHVPFTIGDYAKLDRILKDRNSILGSWALTFLEHPIDAGDGVDAVTAPTPATVQDSVVQDAAYTTWALWHWANGPIVAKVRSITQKSCTPEYLNHLLVSEDRRYADFALEYVIQQLPSDPRFVESVFHIVESGDRDQIVRSLEFLARAMPDKRKLYDRLVQSCARIRTADFPLVLDRLAADPDLPAAVLESLTGRLAELPYFPVHLILRMLEQRKYASEKTISNVAALLDNGDFFIARRAYEHLCKQHLDAVTQTKADAFRERNRDRL